MRNVYTPATLELVPAPDARPFRAYHWAEFERAAAARGTNRSKALHAFIAWYTHQPDTKLPDRPAAGWGTGTTGRGESAPAALRTHHWAEFGEAATFMNTDRSKLLNEFIAWYVHRPDASRPDRPPASWASGEAEPAAAEPVVGSTFRAHGWARFGEATALMGTTRPKTLDGLIAWWTREPGAKLPERPPAGWDSSTGADTG